MGGFGGVDETGYVLLKNLKVELRREGDGDDGEKEADGSFALCFWLYIDNCASYPSAILVQKHPDIASSVPFLWLDDKKRLNLFPSLFLHEEAPDPDNSIQWTEVPCASTEIEFPMKKWVHVGCEVLPDLLRLHVDGEISEKRPLTCSLNKDLHADALKKIYMTCPDDTEDIFHGYVHGLDVLIPSSAVKNHYVKDSPVRLSIDYSSASEIEEDIDGVWSIVGGKASCRRIFSLDVTLLDPFGCPVNKELEVAAALLYADNKAPVENTIDAEPPLLMSYDGIEYASHERPCKLINGRASFKLKISQDFECLRRIAGCRDIVSQENFERLWAWLYPVAFTLSQSAVNSMWNSMSPVWMEGFITKEEAELILTGSGGLQDPGTFVLRFPTSRSWPHPDAGNLVVTYVGSDYTIHHRLLSFDFINSSSITESPVKPLQDLLLEEPELSRLGRALISQFSLLFALTVSSLATSLLPPSLWLNSQAFPEAEQFQMLCTLAEP
ncbi:UNVERIFIED_CONTAM: SH2 domain-containing protein A [Sesamum indicum]